MVRILKSTTAPKLSELATKTYSFPCNQGQHMIPISKHKNIYCTCLKTKSQKRSSKVKPVTIVLRVSRCSSRMGKHHHALGGTFRSKNIYKFQYKRHQSAAQEIKKLSINSKVSFWYTYHPSLPVSPFDGSGKNSSTTNRGYWLCKHKK